MRDISLLFGFAFAFALALWFAPRHAAANNDTYYNTTQYIVEYGYPVEQHEAFTYDGETLSIQRIPHGLSTFGSKGPVLLQHGLLDTTATWVINSPQQSLGFILADAGYDVWLVNVRMNSYSFNQSADLGNWTFDWDEHAQDLSPAVDYILSATGHSQLSIVAHSQGATSVVARLATDPDLQSKTKVSILLAPVTYLANEQSPFFSAAATLHLDQLLELLLGDTYFTPTPGVLKKIFAGSCSLFPSVCGSALSSLFGSSQNLDPNRMEVYTAHWPDVTSVQNIVHWIQNARTGEFNNYAQTAAYQPQNIGSPVAVFYGTNDDLADPADVVTLLNYLQQGGSVVSAKSIDGFAHMDFVWAYEAADVVYPDVITILDQY